MKSVLILFLVCMLGACDKPESEQPQRQFVMVGPQWQALAELKAPAGSLKLEVEPQHQPALKAGDELSWSVTASADSALWIVSVDENDEINVLFPNAIASNNQLKANIKTHIPRDKNSWAIQVAPPGGKNQLVFIVTQGDVSLEEILPAELFKSLGGSKKAIRLADATVGDKPQWAVSHSIITVN